MFSNVECMFDCDSQCFAGLNCINPSVPKPMHWLFLAMHFQESGRAPLRVTGLQHHDNQYYLSRRCTSILEIKRTAND